MTQMWIVEAPVLDQGHQFLGVRNYNGDHQFFWTPDPNQAIHLTTELQADEFSEALKKLNPALFNFGRPVTGDTKSIELHNAKTTPYR